MNICLWLIAYYSFFLVVVVGGGGGGGGGVAVNQCLFFRLPHVAPVKTDISLFPPSPPHNPGKHSSLRPNVRYTDTHMGEAVGERE